MNTLQTTGHSCPASTIDTRSSSILGQGNGLLFAAIGLVATWHDRWQQRRQLERLDRRMLRDIGLDPLDVLRETRKPFWSA